MPNRTCRPEPNPVYDGEALARLFPQEAAERWAREWRDHESAKPALAGFATLRLAADKGARLAETLKIIQETGALERGLSVAVLVQKNDTAVELADYLRRAGRLPAVAESDLRVGTDNPLACALLALFRAAAHPGDTAARTHVGMTPLQMVLAEEGWVTEEALTKRLLGEIHAQGFERTVEAWMRRLEPALAGDDAFSRERGRQLAEAARLFDETGSRDVAEFVQFVERHTVRNADTAAVVRVMTVHKAKGLGFDLVILPDLEGTRLAARRSGLAVQRARNQAVEWVYDLPPATFYSEDRVLAAHVAGAEAEACYEELAVLYVAMTRAKRGMYVITEPVGMSQSCNFPRLLQKTLGEEWASGEERWYEGITPQIPEAMPQAGLALEPSKRAVRHPILTPSETKQAIMAGERMFVLEVSGAVTYGRAVHQLLAQVEWGGESETVRLTALWAMHGAAGQEAIACLRAPGLAEIWAKPAGARVEVWRERAFEIILAGTWVTGVFDRVVVCYNEAGRAFQAAVYDFKTDRGVELKSGQAAVGHEAQITLYRRVVAVLTALPEKMVSAEVVFTEQARKASVAERA